MSRFRHIARFFPTLKKELASYDFGSFIIQLNDIEYSEFKAMRSSPLDTKHIENIKTLYHELRHSVDHISTLWGQRSLVKYFKALNARAKGDPDELYLIVDYNDVGSQFKFDSYFTEHYTYLPFAGLDKRWKARPTIGKRFTPLGKPDPTRPIPFLQFFSSDNRPLMRIPISVASLLETNAKAEEVFWQMQHINSLSETERPFHLQYFANETLSNLIYNQELALYNVAVHACANILNISDILEAFKISSTIATVTLNIPKTLVTAIKPILYNDEESDNRRAQMVKNHEYGFVFICLLENYAKKYNEVKDKDKRQFSIDDLLKCSSLPQSNELESIILSEMEDLFDEVKAQTYFRNIFLEKMAKGREIFSRLGVKQNLTISRVLNESGYKPYIYCDDNTELKFRSISDAELQQMAPFNDLSHSDWFDVASLFAQRMNEFYEIRGI